MFFAVALVLLAPLVLGVIDIYMSTAQRARLQDALDASALYAARNNATDADTIQALGERALNANLSTADQGRIVSSSFVLSGSTIQASAVVRPDSVASDLWTHGNMTVSTNVVRASSNLEVALVLDITGSMSNDMTALKAAANDLINMIVQDVQTPYYTKLAIVPYSNSVNIGSTYMTNVRGAVPAAKTITSASRSSSGGNYYVTFNSTAHGFAVNDYVYITGVTNMTNVNNKAFQITSKTANAFTVLYGTSNPGTSSGTGGQATCTTYGCSYYRFTRNDNQVDVFSASTACVTERTGSDRYTDTAPSTSKVAFKYSKTLNDCPSTSAVPLSTDKTALHAVVNSLTDGGSTAGHIGLAWGWYMVSPNFGYLWSNANSRPAAYGTEHLLKVVILMTDGDFNTAYCNGVVAKNSGTGSGSNSGKINCNANNAVSTTQATSLCTNMKATGKDIIIYTVGFRITAGSAQANLLSGCATDSTHEYLPASGQDLQDAFRAIGQDINSLRLAH